MRLTAPAAMRGHLVAVSLKKSHDIIKVIKREVVTPVFNCPFLDTTM